MRIPLITCALVLTLAASAVAQTHPCDVTPTITPASDQFFGIGFCHDLTTLVKVRLMVDGMERFNGPLSATGTANTAGLFFFQTPTTLKLAAGAHTAQIFVSDGTVEVSSQVLSFTVTPPPLSAPTKLRVVKA